MFQKARLEQLKAQKDLLVLQSDIHRLQLAADWQRLRSPANWMSDAGGLMRRHPLLTAGLAAAAGVLAVKPFRNPGGIFGALGQAGKLASVALAAWKLFRDKTPE